jgi:hypothetical protein
MDPKSPEMAAARTRLNAFDEDTLFCLKQESFSLLKSVMLDQVGAQLVETVPGVADLSYSLGREAVATLIERGLLLGARAYASATRTDGTPEPPTRPVPIYELFMFMRATSEQGHEEHQTFQEALPPNGATTALMGELAVILTNDVVTLDERLQVGEEVILGLGASFIERGAAAEFSIERLLARAQDDASMWNNALGFISGAPDMAKWAANMPPVEALRKVVELAVENGRIESAGECTCPVCDRTWTVTPYDDFSLPECGCFAGQPEGKSPCKTCGEQHMAACTKKDSARGEPKP